LTEAVRRRGLVAGFDAGQTKTICRLRLAGPHDPACMDPLAEGGGPGVAHLAAPQGPERFTAALREALVRARARLADRCDPRVGWPLLAAAIGASGIEVGSAVQARGRHLAAAALGLDREQVVVTGDERTALRGAFPGGAGVVVISGTGTIAVGRDAAGREGRCGGWGWLLDGAGSACDIGRDGLSLSLRMADGRATDGPLRPSLWQALDLDPSAPDTPQRIKALVVGPDFGPAGFARLAPAVESLAAAGEPRAVAILRRNAAALAAMAAAVARGLGLEQPPVCGMGGALVHLACFRGQFVRALAVRLRGSSLVDPAGDACDGALTLAAECLAQAED
jgi:phenylacetic acid degradation operon negative regulatory protein